MRWIVELVIIIFLSCFFYLSMKRMFFYREQRNKNKELYLLLLQWLTMRIDGKTIEQKLINMGARNIVIYGMGILGDQLLYELQKSERINVVYVVDENCANASLRVNTKKSVDNLDDIDLIVISDIFAEVGSFKINESDKKVILLSSLVFD